MQQYVIICDISAYTDNCCADHVAGLSDTAGRRDIQMATSNGTQQVWSQLLSDSCTECESHAYEFDHCVNSERKCNCVAGYEFDYSALNKVVNTNAIA